MKKFRLILTALACLLALNLEAQPAKAPVRIALIGLSHDHALGAFPRLQSLPELELVGIVETNADLIARYSAKFHLDANLFYPSIDALLAHTNVQVFSAFSSTFDHKRIVEIAAAHGIDVMVEKPLAVNMSHARAIQAAARKGNIQVIVNYETTWSAGNQEAYVMTHDQHQIGDFRKFVVHDGHRGPKEIGCSTNFLAWLTDPILDGGGAVNDFGCYGADLVTWLMDGQRPISVTAVTQQIKPDVYPKVEDEATIIMTYPKAQAILQASWNWPFDRKDMEIYGRTGYVIVPRADVMRVKTSAGREEMQTTPPKLTGINADAFAYLAAVVRREIQPTGLSSLDVNMTVVEILDAAHESARTGRRVDLKPR